jgi:hypothetical protein
MTNNIPTIFRDFSKIIFHKGDVKNSLSWWHVW